MGSFIDPIDQERQSKQKELAEKEALIQGKLDYLGKKYRTGPDPLMMVSLRLEHIIDHLYPRYINDGETADILRMDLELDWYDKILALLDAMQEQAEKQSNLIVPGHQDVVNLNQRRNGE